MTLLYPWIPRDSVTDADVDELRSFFTSRRPLAFDLVGVAEFPDVVVYAVPEPDDELRATMRALWALYPRYPPYGRPDSDPTPHATLGRRRSASNPCSPFGARFARRRSWRSTSASGCASARACHSADSAAYRLR